jgi:hypothetical protein
MEQLQTTFYVVGIIFMVLYGLLLIGIVIILFYIWKKISNFTAEVTEKFKTVKQVASHPENIASSVGEALAGTALNQIRKIFRGNG